MEIIGHRGARGLAPENTIASLQKGLEHHVDELEFDVRVTKDAVVVLHHDSYLTDPDGQKRAIESHTYQELLTHKKDLATLEEVIQTIGHAVPLYIEVKPGVPIQPLIKILNKHLESGWKPAYFLLGSKSQKTLLGLHAALPDIEKIVIEPWSGIRATRHARQVGTRRLSMNQRWLWWGFIAPMARGGWQLSAYTLNDTQKARRWAKYGLYGVITDYPDQYQKG